MKDFERRDAQVLVVQPHEGYRIRYMLRYAQLKDRKDYRPRPIDQRLDNISWLIEPGGFPWPILSDAASTAATTYGVAFQFRFDELSNRPATFVIDRGGLIRYERRGKGATDRPHAAEVLQILDDLAAKRSQVELLKSKGPLLRQAAALALRPNPPLEKSAIATLSAALKNEDADARTGAAAALGWLAPHAEAALPALGEALRDEDRRVRRLAAETLWFVGPDAQAVIPALVGALGDKDERVRSMAVAALVRAGPRAVPQLLEALKDPNARARREAAGALPPMLNRSGNGELQRQAVP